MMWTIVIALVLLLVGLCVASAMAELANAPIEREIIVEIDLTSEEDVTEKKQIIERLKGEGFVVAKSELVDDRHVEYILHKYEQENED